MNYKKEILSLNEAVEYLNVSKSLLYKLTSDRKISFSKPNGGKIYFKKSELDAWMLSNECKSRKELEENLKKKIKEDGGRKK
ncbi:helix-turn-helix domain-containing protein [Capnocytophaga stomatis]|uniref:Excisionase n=1 Tax=Capnocytophaga stomatis TaxID=1848904 RepID=A0A250FWQ8_9FLAO|nr:helix-turn-helix domain-containing protein [Capnocytophaga stomatis]ATA89582.1 excisionase [Capnocytophaga stomatis]GIJ92915.1 hypothetical protein CAPN002_01330 [Capnocytophaga stomatis]